MGLALAVSILTQRFALTHAVAGGVVGGGSCPALPQCTCFDKDDDELSCAQGRQFAQLLTWVQEVIDDSGREGEEQDHVPRLDEVVKLRHPWHGSRTIVAGRDILSGELMMRLPQSALMHAGFYKIEDKDNPSLRRSQAVNGGGSSSSSSSRRGGSAAATLSEALKKGLKGKELETFVAEQTWLALYLMEHRRLGLASIWEPYISFLPKAFPEVPVFYGEEELAWLKGSSFVRRIQRHRASLKDQYETVAELVPSFRANYSLDEFLWARSAISTRVFGWRLPDLPQDATDFMVPLGDMFNHRSPKQIEWVFNRSTRSLDFWAREDVPAGSELLISYGGKCNSEYLLHYGFALPGISSRRPPVSTVRLLVDLDDEVMDKADFERFLLKSRLKDHGPLEPEEFKLKAAWKGSEADQLLGYARLLSFRFQDAKQRFRTRSCREFSSPPRCEQATSLENEQAALQRCLRAIRTALAAYPTSMQEDESILATSLSGTPRSLVLLRRDEKLVLQWWQDWFGVALHALGLKKEEIETLADDTYGQFNADGDYLRLRVAPLVEVERQWSASSNQDATGVS